MKHIRQHKLRTGSRRRGFTLVEMLVSVALVLLMMTMFASIFSMATDSVSKQRGIAENDQRARSLTTIIRADFAKRTFRYPLPYYPTENNTTSPTPFGNRGGYIYISTNNQDSGLDDIIQFTVNADIVSENTDQSGYFGASKLLYDAIADVLNEERRTTIRFNPNQPEADDSQIFANGVAGSRAAEISLFVRNGSLIRSVSLLRDPLPIAGQDYSIDPHSNGQAGPPTIGDHPYFIDESDPNAGLGAGNGGQFFYVSAPGAINQTNAGDPNHFYLDPMEAAPASWAVTASNDFWQHFDFSAVPANTLPSGTLTVLPIVPTNVRFIGVDSLDNSTVGGGNFPLGDPRFRFGFNPATGCSREHDRATTQQFMGRFVKAETSDPDFNWPIAPSPVSGNGNPLDIASSSYNLNQATGLLAEFQGFSGRGGARRVEDQLLANVHDLKIEIWDDRLGRFVVPGYGDTVSNIGPLNVGDYHIRRSLQIYGSGPNAGQFSYGPLSGGTGVAAAARRQPHIFDTWHSSVGRDVDGDGTLELAESQPPYIAYAFYPPRQNDTPPGPSSPIMPDPQAVPTANNRGYWVAGDSYSPGEVVFAPWQDSVSGPLADGQFQYEEMPEPKFQIAYRCIVGGDAAATPPTWPRVPDKRISEVPAGGTVVWESFDNRRPLKSVRLTIRFFDQNSESIRQLSLILPLTEV